MEITEATQCLWMESTSKPTFQLAALHFPGWHKDFTFFIRGLSPCVQLSFILHYTNYIGECPEEFHSLSIFKAWNLLAGLSPGHTNNSAIYIQETAVEEATVDHLFMKSKLRGNKLATLKQLKALISRLNISSLDRFFFWVFFKVRSEENNTGQRRK